MAKNAYVDFKAVKAAVKIEEVLRHYNLLDGFKRNGENLSGPCPIHKGSNPTQFRVSLSKNIWNCFSECKNGGNVLDFIAQMEGCSVYAAAVNAVEWFKLDPKAMAQAVPEAPRAKPAVAKKSAPPPESEEEEKESGPNKPLNFRLEKLEREHPFLAERKLKPETIETFGIGFCNKGMMFGRIAIPIANEKGEVVAYAGRLPEEPTEEKPKYKLPPGFRKSLELFNIDRAIKEPAEKPLVIVEGFFDCMALHQNGCPKVVALMGTSLSVEQEDLILKHTAPNTPIIVVLDEDDAGRAGRGEIAGHLAMHRFVRIHRFEKEDAQPRDLSSEEIQKVLSHGRN